MEDLPMTTDKSPAMLCTGIGSLPHHNSDAALAFAFKTDIPFLPQIPIRNPWEYMIAQSLEGLPGLEVEKDGSVCLNLDVWMGRTHALNEKLLNAFSAQRGFEAFEPSPASSSNWQPFLWELEEKGTKWAKIQLAGPLTCEWVMRLKDGKTTEKHPEISTQIFRLVLARAMAMCQRLRALGIQPILFLDEPGLYAFSPSNPRHLLALRELKLMIQTLRKEGVLVGLHCCSNTHWTSVLDLEPSFLSLDTKLSLEPLLVELPAVEKFVHNGGRLSLGVIPTALSSDQIRDLDGGSLFESLMMSFRKCPPSFVGKILKEALYTPACGLALQTPSDAERILELLIDFTKFCKTSIL